MGCLLFLPPCLPCRLQQTGEADVRGVQDALSDLDAQWAALELDLREKADQIQGLQTEKELQAGGEVRELQAEVEVFRQMQSGACRALACPDRLAFPHSLTFPPPPVRPCRGAAKPPAAAAIAAAAARERDGAAGAPR